MENQDKIISKYLSGEMSDLEREAFEKKMNEDDHLRAETELFQLEKLAFEGHLREKMWTLEAEYQQEQANASVEPVAQARRPISFPLMAGIIVAILGINSLITWLIHREFQQRTITTINDRNVIQDSLLQQQILQQQKVFQQQKELQEEVQRLREELQQKPSGSSTQLPARKKAPPVAMNDGFEELKREYQKAGGDKKNLVAAIEENRGILRELGEGDWKEALLADKYEMSWALLQPIISNPKNTPESQPLAFYYAALLKLYWNPKLEGINAAEILQRITVQALEYEVPRFKESTLIRHRIAALYASGNIAKADSLLNTSQKILIKFKK